MLVILFRTLILYLIVIISVRIMGKRQIGEMQPSELVVAIMISDLASVPMQSIDIPLISGIIPVLTLIIAEVFMAFLCLKSKKFRRILSGDPSILISGGHINEKELKSQRFNLNDLMEQLRVGGYPNIADVETAVLETNGQLSIVPKKNARNVTVRDLKLNNVVSEKLPCLLISDGMLDKNELIRSEKNIEWLMSEMKKRNINEIKDVFIASYDFNDGIYIQKKMRR